MLSKDKNQASTERKVRKEFDENIAITTHD